MSHPESTATAPALSSTGRYVILVCAFLGWLCAGFHLAITSLAMKPAAADLLIQTGTLNGPHYRELLTLAKKSKTDPNAPPLSPEDQAKLKAYDSQIAGWFAWCQCAFLFGAASGGLLFGRLGDRWGRSRAMALSILTYSVLSAATSTAQEMWQLLALWFLACTGVGGMWPNGVALVSEAWSSLSRPMAAGIIGTSANIGIFMLSTLSAYIPITDTSWRWIFLVGAAPVVLGLFALFFVPESPHWLATRREKSVDGKVRDDTWQVFSRPWLGTTLVGILLATVPLIGGWGSANWMVPWADSMIPPNPTLKANVQQYRSITGIVGSLLGGWIGSHLGRRRAYFLVSLAALMIAQYTFWFVVPSDRDFLYWVAALGFFSGIYFGWLPLFLPELFPTRIRSTGAGVCFNFGRILTAVTIFLTGFLTTYFKSDYAQMGRVTSLCFAIGMIVIYLAPDTKDKQLTD